VTINYKLVFYLYNKFLAKAKLCGSRPAGEVLSFASPKKKVPKEKATRSASNSCPSRTAQGAAGTCGALTSRRCEQPTA